MSEMKQLESTPAALAFPVEEALVPLCRENFGAMLRAVVLTGSVARNEASYIYKDGQAILLSDIEAIVVLHDSAPLPSRQAAQSLCRSAERSLAAHGVQVHVSLSMVHGAYLRRLPPHIYSYELRACGVVLFGEAAILEEIPGYAAMELSTEDAWRMLSNRLIEQMETSESSSNDSSDDSIDDALRYRRIKLCLDLASSLLVFCGRFEAGYRARLRRIEEFALVPGGLPISIQEFLPLLRLCTAAKLQPGAVAWATGEAAEAGFAGPVTRWAWQSWLWELERMTGSRDHAAAEEMICAFGRSQGGERLLRGWLYAVRRVGWLRSVRYWPKWLWLLARGLTPRHALYLAAYRWQQQRCGETCSDSADSLKRVRELLPVDIAAQPATAAEVARQLAWNYQEFVTETRS